MNFLNQGREIQVIYLCYGDEYHKDKKKVGGTPRGLRS